MKTPFIARIHSNVKNSFEDKFFTSKCLAKRMKIKHEKVSIALSHLKNAGKLQIVGYRKNPLTGHYLNVYAGMDQQKCLWWINEHNAKFVEESV